MDLGIAHKSYTIDIPSLASKNSAKETSNIFAFGFSLEEEFNEHFTFQFEAAKGYTTGNTAYQLTLSEQTVAETFKTQLDYSLSIMGKILPFGRKTLSPMLLIGATTTSISYDYKRIEDALIKVDSSENITSSGILYGLGVELHVADDLDLSLTYVDLSNLKYDTFTVSFEATIKL